MSNEDFFLALGAVAGIAALLLAALLRALSRPTESAKRDRPEPHDER
jgi:hypothetical protein